MSGLARRHAQALLSALGLLGNPTPPEDHPALAWRRAGLMGVSGHPDGPGLVPPVALTSAADGALAALRALAPAEKLPERGSSLLGERARLLGLRRGGRESANRSCRLITTRSGDVALNLARPDDWDLLPALFEEDGLADWSAVERLAALRDREELVARGRLLGLPIAIDETPAAPAMPFTLNQLAAPRARFGTPMAVDLSSLWAGPLAGELLAAAGARVVKVESLHRPDGARAGHPRFFDLMNAGKSCIALDFHDADDLMLLRALLERADIVIEGSRPRALAQLGIDAEGIASGGATWVSITAYGRDGEAADRIGFGDDAAVAGGLASAMARGWGEPIFAGDAIADPLTGITAALVAWAGWRSGGACLASVPLSRVVAHACSLYEAGSDELNRWQAMAEADAAPLYPLRTSVRRACEAGADNDQLGAFVRA
ncbi:CoA transferase [Sphingobium tyrosinilyticum]|uniref:CoA transferase n=1 Tax=Sphingobium tyrosinilyticum TaxID=2715436 RepID=A0ABV9F6R6_9SPHN